MSAEKTFSHYVFCSLTEPQTSVAPTVKDGESIGIKKNVNTAGSVGLLCDAQASPPPNFRLKMH